MSHVLRTPIRGLRSRRDLFRGGLTASVAGMALGSLLQGAPRFDLLPKQPHFPARAKRVILLFQNGGPSQMDLFDPKPLLKTGTVRDGAFGAAAGVGAACR